MGLIRDKGYGLMMVSGFGWGSGWWSVSWSGSWYGFISAVGFALHYKFEGFKLLVVSAADGYQIVDIGGPAVAAPLLDVVEFAAVHGRPTLETASVPDGDREPLRRIGESLAAA